MGNRCTAAGETFLVLLILVLEIHGCSTLNPEGLLLLRFRANVAFDSSGALDNWDPNDCDTCLWSGVGCFDSEVVMLNLTGCYLEGVLPPELGSLVQFRVLDLSKNHFSGNVPPQIGRLAKLEVLDLRDNDLSGTVPPDLGKLKSLDACFSVTTDSKDRFLWTLRLLFLCSLHVLKMQRLLNVCF